MYRNARLIPAGAGAGHDGSRAACDKGYIIVDAECFFQPNESLKSNIPEASRKEESFSDK
ncbi:hypothetical protein DQG23_34060 [Paenibacillus contaminans]|uniref:Uncharacterized protein n=1 Tax=Paenibacillus contaminans TaxID=450362 RepID=A0A329LYV3_9BACL|nr:hypothetical protein DQG23_34060 [Paenibacillus contaminans]